MLTPQTAADLLLLVLCENGEATHKMSNGKAVQGATRLRLLCLVRQITIKAPFDCTVICCL